MNDKRAARISRKTRETSIDVELDLDGTGECAVNTGLPFLDHMLELFCRHALMDIKIKAEGDIQVDYHHTVEDIGLSIGQALNKALADRTGISRYGYSILPMDEALSMVAVDLGGRAYLAQKMKCRKRKILDFDLSLLGEFLKALVSEARMNLHIDQMRGDEAHHACESVFKGLGRAMRSACSLDSREKGVPSTKGAL
ncbi:MAG: imidazoleglycerol-phosphate dehydratase HisB [Kiritimatiellia bacterium]